MSARAITHTSLHPAILSAILSGLKLQGGESVASAFVPCLLIYYSLQTLESAFSRLVPALIIMLGRVVGKKQQRQ
ncbi:hypothetical protein BOTBODRAFT_69795 [Botryobasidium botryosum FD-172 SS1]|uniref:Uncharacterized protein n=1 Tax=Botryobasidium botryosum (strain FD-172 SS1) TaxID=930990 RepID=A0A067M965_BOTB1|nr:hypothetical protein BOTBODRAFT_69795 [Botryobasidium botryosum FD-172 SS1]